LPVVVYTVRPEMDAGMGQNQTMRQHPK